MSEDYMMKDDPTEEAARQELIEACTKDEFMRIALFSIHNLIFNNLKPSTRNVEDVERALHDIANLPGKLRFLAAEMVQKYKGIIEECYKMHKIAYITTKAHSAEEQTKN